MLAGEQAEPARQMLEGRQRRVGKQASGGGTEVGGGPELLLHVWAGNVPALSLWSLICGLLVKAGSIGKLASAEPLTAGWLPSERSSRALYFRCMTAPAGLPSPGRLTGRFKATQARSFGLRTSAPSASISRCVVALHRGSVTQTNR